MQVTKQATHRILQAKGITVKAIEKVIVKQHIAIAIYLTESGRCSLFISLKEYVVDFDFQRMKKAEDLIVVPINGGYRVINPIKNTDYIVAGKRLGCECKDARYRGQRCGHAQAVARYLGYYSLEAYLSDRIEYPKPSVAVKSLESDESMAARGYDLFSQW